MGGPLLSTFPGNVNPTYFLLPHICTLFMVWRLPTSWQKTIDVVATITCTTATLLLISPLCGVWLLPIMGISSAFICLRLCNHIAETTRPILSAACALVTANLLLFLTLFFHLAVPIHTLIAATAILIITFSKTINDPHTSIKTTLNPYLLCLVIFQISFGLMFGHVLPNYNHITFLPGIELFFYLLALPLAAYGIKYGYDILLLIAIGLGMLAFALLISPSDLNVQLSMFSLQAAAGFSDLFVFAWIISLGGRTREFGYALGSVCTGILIGQYLTEPTNTIMSGSVVVGNIALSISLIIFYLFRKKEMEKLIKHKTTQQERQKIQQPINNTIKLPKSIAALLSNQEILVLEKVLEGETYQNIAKHIEISESSVKTYMGRIRGKTGTASKKELVQLIVKQST